MKCITVMQPWASAVALGLKQYETRGRNTNHRGEIAIHAGKTVNESVLPALSARFDPYIIKPIARQWSPHGPDDFPRGMILAIGELTDSILMDEDFINQISEEERQFGDWQPGRYAWKIENVQPLDEPVPASGKQGLWNWEPEESDRS